MFMRRKSRGPNINQEKMKGSNVDQIVGLMLTTKNGSEPNVNQGEEERAKFQPGRRGEGQMLTKKRTRRSNVNQGEGERVKCQPGRRGEGQMSTT